jgi:hypothetical protein
MRHVAPVFLVKALLERLERLDVAVTALNKVFGKQGLYKM